MGRPSVAFRISRRWQKKGSDRAETNWPLIAVLTSPSLRSLFSCSRLARIPAARLVYGSIIRTKTRLNGMCKILGYWSDIEARIFRFRKIELGSFPRTISDHTSSLCLLTGSCTYTFRSSRHLCISLKSYARVLASCARKKSLWSFFAKTHAGSEGKTRVNRSFMAEYWRRNVARICIEL